MTSVLSARLLRLTAAQTLWHKVCIGKYCKVVQRIFNRFIEVVN